MTKPMVNKHPMPDVQPTAGRFFAPLHREFDRLFDQLGDAWGSFSDAVEARMDVRNTKEGVEITLEAPGVDAKDLKVSVDDHILTISGEKKQSAERVQGDYHVSERAFGSFHRSISLPRSVDMNKLAASMKDGVLTLTAPKSGSAEAKRIEIKTAN